MLPFMQVSGRVCLFLLCLFFSPAWAGEILHVTAGNGDTIEMRDRIKAVEAAVNREDLDAYIECFASRLRKTLRHRVGMLFVKHEIAMEILDSHVLDKSKIFGEVAVKYRVTLSGRACEVVAVLRMTMESDTWFIDKETIHSTQRIGYGQPAPCGSACGLKPFQLGGGQAVVELPRNWDPFNPPAHLIDPALEHLRGDIGILPSQGCGSGRCGQPSGFCR